MTDSKKDSETVAIECPWSDLFGKHEVKLFPPILDQGFIVDPHCQHRSRVHAGPPLRLSKLDD